jgi:DNA helicase-2/ATP-dependent DNA helicase PcrA
VLEAYGKRYRYLLVDEFQDTNPPQYRFVQLLSTQGCHILAVGDDDQSIYRFRGAEVGNILAFERDFPQVRVFRLEQNYRSTNHIIQAAQAVIERVSVRAAKRLWTELGDGELVSAIEVFNEQEESYFVVREIRRLVAHGLIATRDCAVLYRTNAQSRALEEAFLREGLPYRLVGGTRFYDRKEIRDMLAYLRLANNPYDGQALERIINVPPRNLGPRAFAALTGYAAKHHVALREAIANAKENAQLTARAQHAASQLHMLLTELHTAAQQLPVPNLLSWLCDRSGYAAYLQDGTAQGQERWQNVQELFSVANTYAATAPSEGLEQFLEQVSLVTSGDELMGSENAVTLLTLHAAKGLEFAAVFLIGMEEGLFPHSRSLDHPEELEEERRLCYVGMTRARRYLYLISAQRRTLFGSTQVNEPSRFIAEIPPEHIRRLGAYGTPGLIDPPEDTLPSRSQPPREHPASGTARTPSPRHQSIRAQLEARRLQEQATTIVNQRYQAGDHVHHKLFGDGIVISSSIRANEEEVIVNFQSAGQKKLIASFAPMVKI